MTRMISPPLRVSAVNFNRLIARFVQDRSSLDGVLALLLFTITAMYVVALPLSIASPDENNALHQAKRLLDGEVMYRDIFDPSMPGWI